MSDNYYIRNKETQKLELHFDKDTYMDLPAEKKSVIKSNFLFSRRAGAWVSRCKFPHLYRAEQIAESLGLENRGTDGEALTFAEQQERKAERAENRAERYDNYSDNAERRGEALQKPINDRHGDIAFFTQPNINTASGRAFTNQRNKMWEAWSRGFEEFKKSDYYAERAEIARETASKANKPEDKTFCERRIAEAEKTIRAQTKNIDFYKKELAEIESGAKKTRIGGEPITKEMVNKWIENAEEIIENAISKSIYYHEWIEKMGGIQFSKENVKVGFVIEVTGRPWLRNKKYIVISTGTKNVKIKDIETGEIACSPVSYADIVRIIDDNPVEEIKHPFKVGDHFTGEVFNYDEHRYVKVDVEVVKVTPIKVTVKVDGGRAKACTVRTYDGKTYFIAVNGLRNFINKAAN